MIIKPNNLKETANILYDILNQGDSRYNSADEELLLADFIMREAISLEKIDIPPLEIKSEEGRTNYSLEVQGGEKIIGKHLLLKEGFKRENIYFERRFRNSVPDIFAEQEGKIILVECCSCRVSKVIDFLTKADEVWILTRGEPPWLNPLSKADTMEWFIFKKGINWSKTFSAYQSWMFKEIKKVKSPLDQL